MKKIDEIDKFLKGERERERQRERNKKIGIEKYDVEERYKQLI